MTSSAVIPVMQSSVSGALLVTAHPCRYDRPTDMANLFQIKVNASQIETSFTIRHVESHLVFGPISRYVPLAYLVFGLAVASLVGGFFATGKPVGQYVGSIVDKLFLLFLPLLLLSMTRRQQAIIGWMGMKMGMGFAAFIMATVGSGVSFQHGYADAWSNLFLGLIWIPGIEFVPRVTPHQRYVTIARILLSLPCIYFGVKSGNWHWS